MTSKELLHCTGNLFSLIYPLSKPDCQKDSLRRRASYDYMVQITEIATLIIREIITAAHISLNAKASKADVFRKAKDIQLISDELLQLALTVIQIRNRITHENIEVNKRLDGYSKIMAFVVFGYSIYNLASQYEFLNAKGNLSLWDNEDQYTVTIDKPYLSNELSRSLGKSDKLANALQKLESDDFVPVITVGLSKTTALQVITATQPSRPADLLRKRRGANG